MPHLLRPLGLAALALAAFPPTNAHAQNVVQDGGFEAAATGGHGTIPGVNPFPASLGDGWAVTQGSCFVFNDVSNPGFPHSGRQGLDLTGFPNTTDTVSQTLATAAGKDYTVSFFAANDNRASTFSVGFGGQNFVTLVPANGTGQANYSFFSFDVTASSASTALTFTGSTPNGFGILLDDVQVTPAAPVPEASSLVSTGLLLALGGVVAGKKRATFKKQSA